MKKKCRYKGLLRSNEKGFTLILSLVLMLIMTLIGISVLTNTTSDMNIATNDTDSKKAFHMAESGIQEALARIHLASTNGNYAGESAGLVYGTRDPSWTLSFTDGESDMAYSVTVAYLLEGNEEGYCDSNTTENLTAITGCTTANGEVVMFGQDFTFTSEVTYLTIGQTPVYEITSEGTQNGIKRQVQAYVGASVLNLNSEYPINTNGCVDVAGAGASIALDADVAQGPSCASGCETAITDLGVNCQAKAADTDMNDFLGLPLDDVKAMADEIHYCTGATCNNADDDVPSSGQIDGMGIDWGDFAGDSYSTYIYIDNAGGNTVSITGNMDGRGLLVVTGNLTISGTVNYEGLIYVVGEMRFVGGGGGTNVTGGVMSGSVAADSTYMGGNIDVDYDLATLQEIARQTGSGGLVLWKRL